MPAAESQFTSIVAKAKGLATSVWGRAWCINLDRYSYYAGRLPQGRTLLRRGQVQSLNITPGLVLAQVDDERSHKVSIRLTPCEPERWAQLRERCSNGVDSLLDLLQGRLSPSVMALMTDSESGLFPEPSEIRCVCTCIDDADLCKHAAAALYGVGIMLDTRPELLFVLREVVAAELVKAGMTCTEVGDIEGQDLADIFGFEMISPVTDAPLS